MNPQGLFRVRLLEARFRKDGTLGSGEVALQIECGGEKSTLLGKGYDFEQYLTSTIMLFDETSDPLLRIFGSDCLREIDSEYQTVYGQVHLEKLKDKPNVKNLVRVICSEKEKEQINGVDAAVIDLEIVYYEKMQGELWVTVKSAILQHDTELIGNMDPYAKLIMGDVVHRTTVKSNAGKTPIWDEQFMFPIIHKNERLVIEIKDKEIAINDLVGLCDLPLRQKGFFSIMDEPVDRTLSIYYKEKVAGTVEIQTKFVFK